MPRGPFCIASLAESFAAQILKSDVFTLAIDVDDPPITLGAFGELQGMLRREAIVIHSLEGEPVMRSLLVCKMIMGSRSAKDRLEKCQLRL